MISVLLVDDHPYVLRDLRFLLETTDDIEVVATAFSGVEAIAKAAYSCPNVAVLDISMLYVGGIETASQIRERCPETHTLMLTILDNPSYVQQALEAGALGYVLKDFIKQDLLAAIRAVSQGNHYFSQKIAPFAENFLHERGGNDPRDAHGEN
jgi:DNA-binding NarL/FixJ family response regulator